MKCKNGLDLCGFQLTNFCIQGEASAPSDAALGRKYFHTNATDDVATGISLLHRERIYLGEGAWRATAYLDDIANLQGKIDALDELLNGEDSQTYVDTWEEVKAFLEGVTESKDLMDLLNAKADKTQLANYLPLSGGAIKGPFGSLIIERNDTVDGYSAICFKNQYGTLGYIGMGGGNSDFGKQPTFYDGSDSYALIHSGNIGSQNAGSADVIAKTYANESINYAQDESKIRIISGYASNSTDLGFPKQYVGGISVISNYVGWQMVSFGSNSIPNPYYRAVTDKGVWGFWKQLAFLDDNVASAQALKHSNGTIGAVVNSSGNVTIGGSDMAGSDYKLYVNGRVGAEIYHFVKNKTNYGYIGLGSSSTNDILISTDATSKLWLNGNGNTIMNYYGGNVLIGTKDELKSGAKLQIKGDVYVDGNIIATKESSAGGAGAEESTSGSGSAEGVSEIFTPTSTSMAFDHNLGEDVIVQVYEKSGNVWNMVMVDTEITSATRVTLRFGKTETTQHKVVIMGV